MSAPEASPPKELGERAMLAAAPGPADAEIEAAINKATGKHRIGLSYDYEDVFEAVRAALSAASPTERSQVDRTGWLIEHNGELPPTAHRGQVSWLCVQPQTRGYGAQEFGSTLDASKALRFARKEDAEAVLRMHLGAVALGGTVAEWFSAPYSVTEHMWHDGSLT